MKRTTNRACHVAAGIALGIAVSSPALADDTEILVGNQLDPGDPNILFIIDTSGSMDSEVVIGDDYDPQQNYDGNCNTNRYYWAQEGSGTIQIPDCNTNAYVTRSAYQCDAGKQVLDQFGQFRDRHAQWDEQLEPKFWAPLVRATSDPDFSGEFRLTECATDAGQHGDSAGEFYPADGAAGPWSTNPDDSIIWDMTGDSYTFYSGNYLNWIEQTGPDTTLSSRMKVVQQVARDVLTPITGVNVGLMRFSTNAEGGMVLHEMVPVTQGRNDVLDSINALRPQGATPLAETLYEAGQYYAGRAVDFGVSSEGFGGVIEPSVAESQSAPGIYDSPISLQCQRNYVVLLTDGLPNGDTDGDARIQDLPGFGDAIGTCAGNCLDEMAKYLNQVDQRSTFPEAQTVQTFTIGFDTDQQLLEDTATGRVPVYDADDSPVLDEDGEPQTRPGYFIANDQEELTSAFEDILAAIQSDGASFTAPAISVDLQNRLTNRADLYFTLFQPATRGQKHWDGNLKKYRIGRSSATDATPTVIDVNNEPAVDNNGLFQDGAQSYWSLSPDEGDVTNGGFIGTLTTNRNIYTNVSGDDLTADNNSVHEDNEALTAAILDIDPEDVAPGQRESLLRWARGVNPDGTVRATIGDPLHSAPVLLAYASDHYSLFFGTNDGYLHAIDPEPTGRGVTDIERFAFIPKELLPQLAELKLNMPQPQYNAPKAYGLDGPITAWIDEETENGIVEADEDAYLFVGMRRGGRNYYALDVSDKDNPQLAWDIIGGAGNFVELGQTWSAPIPSRVYWEGEETQVLFFAGGNDDNQDSRNRPTGSDDMGRAIYMVNARTGARLWWASIRDDADLTLSEMTHSIPSDLRVIDVNQDGLDDRIYVGDTAGKVWRFDIDNSNGTITGDVFADLGGADESGNRRIYSAPSVTRIFDQTSDTGTFLTVSVGTGHRAHPLERDVNDGFYMIRDVNVFSPQVNSSQEIEYPAPITRDDLLDVTSDVAPTTTDLIGGWFIDFDTSEKSLSSPLAVLDKIFFTTYIPTPLDLGCQPKPVLGNGRLYAVNILTGVPLYADSPTPDDRYRDLDTGGIPPGPTLVFTPPNCEDCDSDDPVSEITMLVGTETIDDPAGTGWGQIHNNVAVPTYWVQEDIDR